MNYLLIFFIGFLITEISTPYLIGMFKKRGLVDKPEERKIHTDRIPRMGGIIIYSVVIILLQAFYQDLNSIKLFFTGSIIIFICGLADDIYDLDWRVKFAFQSAASFLLLMRFVPAFNSISLFGIILPIPISYIILFLFILGTINSINLLDGLDGLVSGYSILFSVFIGAIAFFKGYFLLMVIIAALLGTLLAFLKYNSFPAKIFLGDTGSLVLGYFITFGSIEVLRAFNQKNLDLTFPILLLGVPILDTLKVMFLRIKEGKLPFVADKKHLHHVIFENNVRHKTTVFIIHLISIAFMSNALIYLKYHNILNIILFFGMGLFLLFASKFAKLLNQIVEYVKEKLIGQFELPEIAKRLYSNIVTKISVVVSVIMFAVYFKPFKETSVNTLLAMLAAGTVLFMVSLIQFGKKEKVLTPFYFVMNLIFAFSAGYFLKDNSGYYVTNFFNVGGIVLHIPFLILAGIVLVFLIARYSLIPKDYVFLSGFDLTLFTLTIMLFILQPFSQLNIVAVNYNLIIALVIYLWLKILMYYKIRTAVWFYFGLYIYNFTTLVYSLIR